MTRGCAIGALGAVAGVLAWGLPAAAAGPSACGSGGSCTSPHAAPGCDDAACCASVCAVAPDCCDVEWDLACVEMASLFCAAAEPCLADVDDSEAVDLGDFLGVLGQWGQSGPYDIYPPGSGDGTVDVSDLLLVLEQWGPCPAGCSVVQACTGACCKSDLSQCVTVSQAECGASPYGTGWLYVGDGTVCPPPLAHPLRNGASDFPGNPGPYKVGELVDFVLPNAVAAPGDGGVYPVIPATQGGAMQYSLRRDGSDLSAPGWTGTGSDLLPGFDIGGRIRYPATADGLNVPCVSGQHPLVIIAHGNHRPYQGPGDGVTTDQNYRGYTYFQDLLATRGFISISVTLDDFYVLFPGILARGWVTLCHLENFEQLNIPASHILQNHIDWTKVALVGHSRGGEAVVQAQMMDEKKGGANSGPAIGPGANEGRFHVKAVFSLAATRFFDEAINWDLNGAPEAVVPSSAIVEQVFEPAPPSPKVPSFLGMWGDSDGDVSGNGGNTTPAGVPTGGPLPAALGGGYMRSNHVQGMYDLCPIDTYRHMVWIEGANHNFWNTSWYQVDPFTDDVDFGDDGLNTGVTFHMEYGPQKNLLTGYGVAFLLANVKDLWNYERYFRYPANKLPPTTSAATRVHLQYQVRRTPNNIRLVVDNFETKYLDYAKTSENQDPVDVATLTMPAPEEEPEMIGAARFPAAGPEDGTRSWFHDTRAVFFEWTADTDNYKTLLLKNGSKDVAKYPFLSFRIAQDIRDANTNANLEIKVAITDVANKTGTVEVKPATVTTIPVGQARTDGPAHETGLLTKSVLKTVRIPMCDFKKDEPALNLKKIKFVKFTFSGRAAGQAALDNIEFAP